MNKELHQALHDANLYSYEAHRGAQTAFRWLVEQLYHLPADKAVERLKTWSNEINSKDEKDIHTAQQDDNL